MRFILLVRHGESADKQPGQSDFDRVITSRGRNAVEQLGSFLQQEKLIPKIIISSSAIRTKQTVESIIKTIEAPHPIIQYEQGLYQGSEHDYLDFISKIDSSTDVAMLVGHNPSISSLIGLLTGQHAVALHPGQVALIQVDTSVAKLLKLIGPFLK
jgi:phosphohistidine phosphatase